MSPTSSTKDIAGGPDHGDVEKDAGADYAHLTNTSVQSYSWANVTVTVKDRKTKQRKDILSGINGIVKAGESILGWKLLKSPMLT
jgi:hypothetical protein